MAWYPGTLGHPGLHCEPLGGCEPQAGGALGGCGPQAGEAVDGCEPHPADDLARPGYLGLVHHMISLGKPDLWPGWLVHNSVHATCTLSITSIGLMSHQKSIVMTATKFQSF